MGLKDFCYAYFKPLGRALSKAYKGLDDDMAAANMKITPAVYLSMVGFLAVLGFSVPLALLLVLTLVFKIGVLMSPLLWIVVVAASPATVIVVGLVVPKLVASNRVSGLKTEIPYASMYMSVMATGGLSPYASLLRLRRTGLLPKLREEIKRIQNLVLSLGSDPVSAMEKAAKVVDLKEYKDLLLGYASALRTGGDVLHYLFSQTKNMFRSAASRIRAMGENMGMLMETYTIVGILGALGLYMMFVVSFSLPEAGMQLSPESFFLFSFVVLPIVSVVFIYLGDSLQISYPVSYWKTYIALGAVLPLGLFLITQTALPFLFPGFPAFPPLMSLSENLVRLLGFQEGCEPALGMAFSLIVISIPVIIVDHHYAKEEKGVLQGLTTFLRDLVENRKSGLSPERCIHILSKRDYGRFSKHLRRISSELGWGFPLRKIFADFQERVTSWLSQVNLYLLVDTIEVGGGNEESLEILAEFSEDTRELEKERRSLVAPLVMVPFIGAALLTATTVLFLQFFSDMTAMAGSTVPYLMLSRTLLTPLVLHSFMLGLVTGKITSGRVSSGFKLALLLAVVSLGGVWLASRFLTFSMFG